MVSSIILIAACLLLLNPFLSDTKKVVHRIKPHPDQTVTSWPIIRVFASRPGSRHKGAATFLHQIRKASEHKADPDALDDQIQNLENEVNAVVKGEPGAEGPAEKPHPASGTQTMKTAKGAISQSEEKSLTREIEGLARSADSLAKTLVEEEKQQKERQAEEAAKQLEETAKLNAHEKALDAETEAEDMADKIEISEKEKENESRERAENEVDNAKINRENELYEDKEMIQEAKEKAESEVAKKAAEEMEEHAEKNAEKVLKEQENVEEQAENAAETEGLMSEKTSENKLESEREAEAEAIIEGQRKEEEAKKELEHRKQLQSKEIAASQQEKLKERLAGESGNAIHGRCFGSTFLQNCKNRGERIISAHNARSFLRSLQLAGNPAIKQEDAEVGPAGHHVKNEENVEPKAVVGKPSEDNEENGHGDGHAKVDDHEELEDNSLSASQWAYLAIIFPAGVTLAALSLLLFV